MEVKLTIEDGALKRRQKLLTDRLQDLRPVLSLIGHKAVESMAETFDEEGRPDAWPALSAVTLKNKRPGLKILEGETQRLREGIHVEEVTANAVSVVPDDLPYARIQHLGGKAGRGHSVTIPAREYLLVQEEDLADFNELLLDFATGGL